MTSTADLTQGPIRRQMISLALPLLASNILQQLYNTVDVAIVGRCVGEEAFAAVGVAGSVMNLFLFLITGCCNGVGALFSQSRGAGDGGVFRREFFLASVFGGGASLALAALAALALPVLLTALRTPPEIADPAAVYLRVIFLGFLPAFAYQLGFAVLRSVGNTAAALGFLMASMAANLALDILFVAGFHWGIAGAAWATVLAQTLAAVCCQVYLRRRFSDLVFRRADMGCDPRLLGRIARFSLVSALHMCSLYIGKLLVQGTVNGLGAGAITAYTAATRVEGFANSFGDSGAASMSVFTGQNTGAGDGRRSRAGFFTGERLLAALGLVMSALMIAGAVPALSLVLPEGSGEAVLAEAQGYLRLVACFYLFNFLGSGIVGYFQGRGLVNLPAMGAAGHITVRVVLSALLAPHMGLPAVALATGLGWVGVVSVWSFPLRRDLRRAASQG
nr:MATE family efflux transporter [uncultured Oscillibacter sp.]